MSDVLDQIYEDAIEAAMEKCQAGVIAYNCAALYQLFFDTDVSCSNALAWLGPDKVKIGLLAQTESGQAKPCANVAFKDIPDEERRFVQVGEDDFKLRVNPPSSSEAIVDNEGNPLGAQATVSTLLLKKVDTEYEACVGPYRDLSCRMYSLFFDSFDSCTNAADWIGADKLQYGSSSLDGKAGDLCARVEYTEIPSR